jgi:hypothetical protein
MAGSILGEKNTFPLIKYANRVPTRFLLGSCLLICPNLLNFLTLVMTWMVMGK